MSNQFFDFLADTFINWFERENIVSGNRYHLILDDAQQVIRFYQALQKTNHELLHFDMHSDGLNFSTNALKLKQVKLVIVATTNSISPDFLVTLRNRVAAQNGIWKGTAIVFLSDHVLDSISGGAMDISSSDGPLNIGRLKQALTQRLAHADLGESDRQIIDSVVKELGNDSDGNLTLLDFAPIFHVIEKEKIDRDDFAPLGLFPDQSLQTIRDSEIRAKRILANQTTFDQVEELHDLAGVREQIHNNWPLIKNSDLQQLASDDWRNTNFNVLSVAIMEQRQSFQNIAKFDAVRFTSQTLPLGTTMWVRNDEGTSFTEGRNTQKSRHYNILVFIETDVDEPNVQLQFPFNAPVKANNIELRRDNSFVTRGHLENGFSINFSFPGNRSIIASDVKFSANRSSKASYQFRIIALRMSPEILRDIRSRYRLRINRTPVIQVDDVPNIIDLSRGRNNQSPYKINNSDDLKAPLNLLDQGSLDLSELEYSDRGKALIHAQLQSDKIDIEFVDSDAATMPINPFDVNALRRASKANAILSSNGTLSIGTRTYYVTKKMQRFFGYEKSLLASQSFFGSIDGGKFVPNHLSLPEEVQNAISQLRSAYIEAGTLPSLAVFAGSISKAVVNFIETIEHAIASLPDNVIPSLEIQNISRIGTLVLDDTVYYSPLSPFLLNYGLHVDEEVRDTLLSRKQEQQLTPLQLIPFIFHKGELHTAVSDPDIPRWLTFNKMRCGTTASNMREIVGDRLLNFSDNFHYLLDVSPSYAIHVCAINVLDRSGIIGGILDYLVSTMTSNERLNDVHPVEIYFKSPSKEQTDGDLLTDLYSSKSLAALTEAFKLDIPSKLRSRFSNQDILYTLQKSVVIYDKFDSDQSYHLSFYQYLEVTQQNIAEQRQLAMNYSINGLLSDKEYTEVNDLATGFGVRGDLKYTNRPIIKFASIWNELLAATHTSNDQFSHGKTIVNYASKVGSEHIGAAFEDSDWVTFIDPRISVDFFNKADGLYVVHYAERDGGAGLTSITVTNKISRYNQILTDTLNQIHNKTGNPDVLPDNEGIKEIISSFNLFNGTWLLRILRNRHNMSEKREKLSMLAAYKILEGILDQTNMYWVPISLEEVLRISGAAGLKMQDGFVSSTIKHFSASDDILMMGLDVTNTSPRIILLPAEVKVGENSTAVISKAEKQLHATSELLKHRLISSTGIINKLFANFFLSLFINAYKKMSSTGSFQHDQHKNIDEILLLLHNNLPSFTLGTDKFGKGFLVTFSEGTWTRRLVPVPNNTGSGYTRIDVPESDAYVLPTRSIDSVITNTKNGRMGFTIHDIPEAQPDTEVVSDNGWLLPSANSQPKYPLHNSEDATSSSLIVSQTASITDQNIGTEASFTTPVPKNEQTHFVKEDNKPLPLPLDSSSISKNASHNSISKSDVSLHINSRASLTQVRLPLGCVVGGNNIINWEYGNPNLSNRHMLVTGKSGQGKTYFMQGLLLELSKQGISSLVIDYTNSYITSQLDPVFIKKIGAHLHTVDVKTDKLPINPFRLGKINLGAGEFQTEESYDMVERVAETLTFVFDLGPQQESSLVDLLMEGYEKFGERYTFRQLKDQLSDPNSTNKLLDTLKGRLQKLIYRDIFRFPKTPFDWGRYFNGQGDVNVIQLAGYQNELSSAITEFILWDLFNYSQATGTEASPLPVFLDEVQNLDFSDDAPTTKILREGRKFGWSGVFSTQSVTSINDKSGAIWNTATQVHFLPPEDQTALIAKLISSDLSARKETEGQLRHLTKGHALFNGPLLDVRGLNSYLSEMQILQMEDR